MAFKVFQWIVRRINSSIEMVEHGFIIGVLDIYGNYNYLMIIIIIF